MLSPIWLLSILPLGAALAYWRLPSRFLNALRAVILLLLVLAMAGLTLRLPSRAGVLVVVADRSRSMPAGYEAAQLEQIELVQKNMRAGDRLAVVSFAEKAVTEHPPQLGKFTRFNYQLGPDASNLHDGIERALSLIESDSPGRMLVLSDGRWTGRDPLSASALAAARSIGVDYRLHDRPTTTDLAIEELDVPASVSPHEGYMLTAWVRTPLPQRVTYELLRGGQRIAAGARDLPAGLSRLTFRDSIPEPSTGAYTLIVKGEQQDSVPENNTAQALVGVQGPRPVLLLTRKENSNFARLLQGGGLNVRVKSPQQASWSLADLSNYSAVVIEELPASDIGQAGLENLAQWVPQTGAGLMLTGGKASFGPGGYFKSPLDPVMPVSMELRKEHRKLSLAIVVTMDRSGSMAVTVPGGQQKMQLANLAASRVVEMLSPYDQFSAWAVDSVAHEIVPLQNVENPAAIQDKIRRIDSGGGGIFVYEALSHAAATLAQARDVGARHIILFADAADSEEPGRYVELLEECRRAGITCSVIGLGRETDVDANLLRDIAKRGEGRVFFTEDATNLPLLFAQDTFAVARSSFIDEITGQKPLPPLASLTGRVIESAPAVGGYNLTYLKENADQAITTEDEYKAPVVASWQVGSGRAMAYTAQIDGEHTGPVAQWPQVGDYLTSLVRWVSGQTAELPDGSVLTQSVREGIVTVELHLDPQRARQSLASLPSVSVLRGRANQQPSVEQAPMAWVTPDTLALRFPLFGTETAIATVQLPDQPAIAMPPVTLPYSPEFKPQTDDRGVATLARLAASTGGRERLDLASIWKDLPVRPRFLELGPFLLMAAVVLLLLEVLERRTGLLTGGLRFNIPRRRAAGDRAARVEPAPKRTAKTPPRHPTATPAVNPDAQPSPQLPSPEPTSTVAQALTDARRSAQHRTRKN